MAKPLYSKPKPTDDPKRLLVERIDLPELKQFPKRLTDEAHQRIAELILDEKRLFRYRTAILRPYEEIPGLQAGRQQLFSYAPIASALDVIFKTLQDVSVLEIGAGNVCFFHYLRDKGASPSILDADYMEYKMGVKEGMDVHEGDVTEMHKHPAFRGRRFDVVVTNNVFSRGSAKATKAILSDENIPLAVRNISEKVRVGGFYIDYRSDMAIVSSYLSQKKFRVIMKEDGLGGLLIAQRIK